MYTQTMQIVLGKYRSEQERAETAGRDGYRKMEAPVQSWAGAFFMKATNFQERIYRVARVVLHYRGDEEEACS